MGLLPKFLQRHNSSYALTDTGKNKHDKYEAETGTELNVLVALNDYQPCTLRELAKHTDMEEHQVKSIVGDMVKRGWVEPRNRDEE